MYMQIAKSQSEILTEREMWISAEKHTDVKAFVWLSKKIEGLSFLAVIHFHQHNNKVLRRRTSYSLASQVSHYNSP